MDVEYDEEYDDEEDFLEDESFDDAAMDAVQELGDEAEVQSWFLRSAAPRRGEGVACFGYESHERELTRVHVINETRYCEQPYSFNRRARAWVRT